MQKQNNDFRVFLFLVYVLVHPLGDIDGIVPITGTRAWLRSSNFTVDNDSWKSWTDSNKQTGGWTET